MLKKKKNLYIVRGRMAMMSSIHSTMEPFEPFFNAINRSSSITQLQLGHSSEQMCHLLESLRAIVCQ